MAENAAIKLARKNQLLYGSTDTILGNQWIPLKEKATIQSRARAAGILDEKCGGGAILHCNIDAPFASEEQAWKMLNYLAQQGVIYFAFNLRINVCENNHSFTTHTCPHCGKPPVESYQRIVGYLVPLHSWSEGRRDEFGQRTWMNLNDEVIS